MENKELEIRVEEKTKKDSDEKFLAYKVLSPLTNRWITLWFTKEIKLEDRPTKNCILVVPSDCISVDDRGKFPVCFVSKILEVKEIVFKNNTAKYF